MTGRSCYYRYRYRLLPAAGRRMRYRYRPLPAAAVLHVQCSATGLHYISWWPAAVESVDSWPNPQDTGCLSIDLPKERANGLQRGCIPVAFNMQIVTLFQQP